MTKQKDYTRVFFVVDAMETNKELYTTLEQAEDAYDELNVRKEDKPRIYVAMVRNAYKEGNDWNYEDFSDTFQIIEIIK
jgi:DNA polymerase II large subunit